MSPDDAQNRTAELDSHLTQAGENGCRIAGHFREEAPRRLGQFFYRLEEVIMRDVLPKPTPAVF
jgi:hypothetical protein